MSECDGCKETSENWQQQVEEIIALKAIYGDDFRLLRDDGSPEDLLLEELDSAVLAAFSPVVSGVHLKGEVTIRVEVPGDEVSIRVEGGPDSSNAAATGGEVGKVQHLPPLSLYLTFHSDYPGSTPPSFILNCLWLDSKQLSAICAQLDVLWEVNGTGAPICFLWIDWITNSALEYLGISKTLILQTSGQNSCEDVDSRIRYQDGAAIEVRVGQLLRFNAHQRVQLFRQGTWGCPICMEDTVGQNCVRLPSCNHYFCCKCFAEYCKVNIQDGHVDLRCPQHKCDAVLEPHVLRSTLMQEEYERWESLTLQRTLDKMQDVWYCPRCNMVCLEDAGNIAQCPKCLFVFCTLCFQSYHPGIKCTSPETKLEELCKVAEAQINKESKEAQQRLVSDLRQEKMSKAFIEGNTRICPGCNMRVEHSGGCNKMVCVYCNCTFCYKCGQMIEGYSHFWDNSICTLFSDEEIEAWENQMNPMREPQNHEAGNGQGAGRRNRTVCPSCKQENLKLQRNNHIRCWACGIGYCYLCKQVLTRRAVRIHFTTTGCKQHSDD